MDSGWFRNGGIWLMICPGGGVMGGGAVDIGGAWL